MKRISLVVIAALLMATAFGIVAEAQEGPGNIGYFGLQYSTRVADGEKKLILSGGYGTRIKGNLWELNTGQIASRGYVSLEPSLAYVFDITSGYGYAIRGALHAGPSADWINTEGTGPWNLYVPGAIGGTLYFELPSNWGAGLSARQKFTFKDGTQYEDGWVTNFNVTKRF